MIGAVRLRFFVFRVGAAIIVANPVVWVLAINFLGFMHASDKVWGEFIGAGMVAGTVSFLLVLLGKREGGRGRIAWVLTAFVETFCWWFMTVSL